MIVKYFHVGKICPLFFFFFLKNTCCSAAALSLLKLPAICFICFCSFSAVTGKKKKLLYVEEQRSWANVIDMLMSLIWACLPGWTISRSEGRCQAAAVQSFARPFVPAGLLTTCRTRWRCSEPRRFFLAPQAALRNGVRAGRAPRTWP